MAVAYWLERPWRCWSSWWDRPQRPCRKVVATGLQSLGAGFSLQSSPLLISVLRRP